MPQSPMKLLLFAGGSMLVVCFVLIYAALHPRSTHFSKKDWDLGRGEVSLHNPRLTMRSDIEDMLRGRSRSRAEVVQLLGSADGPFAMAKGDSLFHIGDGSEDDFLYVLGSVPATPFRGRSIVLLRVHFDAGRSIDPIVEFVDYPSDAKIVSTGTVYGA